MPYPLLCRAGYPVPEAEGCFEIIGVSAVPDTAGTAMVVELRDIWGALDDDPQADKYAMVKFKSDGNLSMSQEFDPPIRTRRGIRAGTLTNTSGVIVYVR